MKTTAKKKLNLRQLAVSPVVLWSLIIALFLTSSWWVYVAIYEKNVINEEQAVSIAYGQAVKKCFAIPNITPIENCKNPKHVKTQNLTYYPTDGADEYVGNWIITYEVGKINWPITVYLDSRGAVVSPAS